MDVRFEIEENDQIVARVDQNYSGNQRASEFLRGVAEQLQSEAGSLVKELGIRNEEAELGRFLGKVAEEGRHLKIRRVCVDLHFESEHAEHRFLSRDTWGDVHEWACRHFHVAADACANLELREGAPTGPALNDNSELGKFRGCKTVWMVKPGPEPNGACGDIS